jgi:CRP/FNR family transcriptional regulator, cyclic AMP receptor protein
VLTVNGEQAIVTILGPGKVFGELTLVDGHSRRTATITAWQPCETISLRRCQFEKLLELHPQVQQVLLASLAAQVERLSEHLLEVLFSPTPRGSIRIGRGRVEVLDRPGLARRLAG